MASFLFLLLLFQGLLFAGLSWARRPDHDHECMPKRCSDSYGPVIRFPFWLKGHQPDHCGYPGRDFELSCSPSNDTLLALPFFWTASVWKIDYESQIVFIGGGHSCFLGQPPNLNSSSSTSFPFYFVSSPPSSSSYDPEPTYTCDIFSCPSTNNRRLYYSMLPIACPSRRDRTLYAVEPGFTIFDFPLLSCTKIYTIPSFPFYAYNDLYEAYKYGYEYGSYGNYIRLRWSKPSCGKCEAKGQNCRLTRNNSSSTEHETECFGIPNPAFTGESETKSPAITSKLKSLIVTGALLGLFLLLVVVIRHRSKISKKEDQVKIERFLENYRALKPTRYTYAEVKKITNKFKDKLGQGGYGTVYKGELSNEVHVAAKILNNFKGEGDDFINEVGTIGKIHHVNVVRLVGYCADGFRRALVYEYLPNDSLEKFISSDQEKRSLGWEKLQNIALGIAKGIEYLHQGCDQRILHFDIKPHNILLDHNFNPKISDFGLAKLCSKEQSAVSMTAARGTIGYIAPEVFSRNFGNVSCKSDVYSFGMLLLEMIGGRKNTGVTVQNTSEVYFPEWIYNSLSHGEEPGIEIEEDGDAKIVKKLTIVGLWCIQWYPGDRPSMKVVIQMLEGDVDTLAMPPNPFATTNAMTARGTTGGRPFNSTLEVISESE